MARRKQTMDGNAAAAHVSYAFTEVATIFPITPSSVMPELIDEWSAQGRKNIFGGKVVVREMQSEGGAAGAMHGSLLGGALTTTYTASQGLMLMLPVIYRLTGELLPAVFHVASRSLGTNAFSIFGEHQDVMALRQIGTIMLCSSDVQECMDLGAVAHLSAIKSRIPVIHFFDGFRTSHEMQKIEVLEYDELANLVDKDALEAFRANALNPDHPTLHSCTHNPDTYFQMREAVNKFYTPIPDIVQGYMDEINRLTGRDYRLFNYYGSPTAENIIVAMGSGCSVVRETIEYQNAHGGNYGLLQVHLYRPLAVDKLVSAIPNTVKRIAVLDRTKEPGSAGEPLYRDVCQAFFGKENAPHIVGGRFGISSKDFTPADVLAVFANLEAEEPKNGFTVGINDDVTFLSLPPYKKEFDPSPAGTVACKLWGFGSDGTVGANKSAIKIIGDHTEMNVQAYFAYDARKSGGLTVSHLRFGKEPIYSSYLVNKADFIACHKQTYVNNYDLLEGIKPGGCFLLNCGWSEEELDRQLPASLRRAIAGNKVEFYMLNGVKIAHDLGLGNHISMIMQAAFFQLANIIPIEDAVKYLDNEVEENFSKRGPDIVNKNKQAIREGFKQLVKIKVPDSWISAEDEPEYDKNLPEFVQKFVIPVRRQQGDKLPVSVFNGRENGEFPIGTSKFDKFGSADYVAQWKADKCLQCNQCSYICPAAAIRPKLLTAEQAAQSPASIQMKNATGFSGMQYSLAISSLDCTGCSNCVNICPAPGGALEMVPIADNLAEKMENWEYLNTIPAVVLPEKNRETVKGSQFLHSYLEFPAACAGCCETPYARLVTQLYGDRMVLANTASCLAVWGGSTPTTPYTVDDKGRGPAWGYSLFEDEAEYALGLSVGSRAVRTELAEAAIEALTRGVPKDLEVPLRDWLNGYDESQGTRDRAEKLEKALQSYKGLPLLDLIYNRRDYLTKRTIWVFGGDGWAYDIGYGGLDHVLASGEKLNFFVFDNELYANTGGQSSKASPTASVVKFASSGKETAKKDLGRMAMSYGNIYVAQVSMGADYNQTLRAVVEAENFDGPSLIIGYSPCINHGLKAGMETAQLQQKRAVACGYWSLYRFNPDRKAEGKNPFQLDSKEPTADFCEFLLSETRFSSLLMSNPREAERLLAKTETDAKNRLAYYKFLNEHAI